MAFDTHPGSPPNDPNIPPERSRPELIKDANDTRMALLEIAAMASKAAWGIETKLHNLRLAQSATISDGTTAREAGLLRAYAELNQAEWDAEGVLEEFIKTGYDVWRAAGAKAFAEAGGFDTLVRGLFNFSPKEDRRDN